MLRNHAVAATLSTKSLDGFITDVRTDFRGRRLQVTKLRRVYALAERSVGLRDGTEVLQVGQAGRNSAGTKHFGAQDPQQDAHGPQGMSAIADGTSAASSN